MSGTTLRALRACGDEEGERGGIFGGDEKENERSERAGDVLESWINLGRVVKIGEGWGLESVREGLESVVRIEQIGWELLRFGEG